MKHPLYIGALVAACLAVGAAATLWLGATIFRLDREQREYQQRAALEEKVRLALWRMDSALGPFIAAESMRPYNLYSAFYPTAEAVDIASNAVIHDPVLLPSPLLTFSSPYIRLHFQIDAAGQLSSPQLPDEEQRPLAQEAYLAPGALVEALDRLRELRPLVQYEPLLAQLQQTGTGPPPIEQASMAQPATDPAQATSNISELLSRRNQATAQQQAPPTKLSIKGGGRGGRTGGRSGDLGWVVESPPAAPPTPSMPDTERAPGAPGWNEDPMIPLWAGGELLLARTVRNGGPILLQGCWLDWPAINAWLLGLCEDLLPGARLVPADNSTAWNTEMPGRQLASLPARLVPGPQPTGTAGRTSPVRIYLLASVGGIAVATLALTALLWGAVSLSERRGRFVSAVTHELRTPLTTFRLYTEMLAGGMVCDPEKRQQYYETLHEESARLSHLVENVLAYARLERVRLPDRLETLPAGKVLEKVAPRLEARAAQGGMSLALEISDSEAPIRVDPDLVEQILYNLVDNACKYASAAGDRRIHVRTALEGRFVAIRVSDHGPGIPPRDARRIFRPFTKSVHEAARSAPGVGLGLGLSRRLAASIGATLRLEPHGEGACFTLRVPRQG
ncbi:MAG: HAMP domain-containing histidine kinase [Candidatus Hydrogenedentes bacterium]|nr:HAMP domain-containing histidine kinase [Candidatus Hydrogenedentota bacterium]